MDTALRVCSPEKYWKHHWDGLAAHTKKSKISVKPSNTQRGNKNHIWDFKRFPSRRINRKSFRQVFLRNRPSCQELILINPPLGDEGNKANRLLYLSPHPHFHSTCIQTKSSPSRGEISHGESKWVGCRHQHLISGSCLAVGRRKLGAPVLGHCCGASPTFGQKRVFCTKIQCCPYFAPTVRDTSGRTQFQGKK